MGAIETGVELYQRGQRVLDDMNRNGYEWFMHFLGRPKATWHYYRERYESDWPVARFIWAVVWRLPLMVIPVLPALYLINRTLGVLLNPFAWRNNVTKPLAMLGMLAAGALALSFPYLQLVARPTFAESAGLITKSVLPFVVSKAVAAPMAIGLLLWGGLLVGAGLLYAGKHLARAVNQAVIGTTTRKHHVLNIEKSGRPVLPPLLMKIYKEVRTQHQALKNKLNHDPADIKFIPPTRGGIAWIHGGATSNNIESAEGTLETGKELLGRLEKLMGAQLEGEPVDQHEANEVILQSISSTKSTLYRQWSSEMGVVKDQHKADTEVSALAYNEHKIIVRSRLES